jgi:large subunit ribosomal protein L23
MKNIIIRPILTEKSTALAENSLLNQYTFEVLKSANKIEIRKAVEEQFGVTVESVNTSIRPGKAKARVVKGRQTKGRTSAIKKAIITVAEGEFIEGFYGEGDYDDVELLEDEEEASV